MKRLFVVGGIAAILFASSAMAADLPVYKAPPPPVAVPTWTGFYVGGNIGYSWGDAQTDFTASGSTVTSHAVFPGTFPTNFYLADSNNAGLSGVVGGGQIGYNFQFSPRWLVGVEADIQGSGERGSNTFVDQFSTPLCVASNAAGNCLAFLPLNGTAVTSYDAKIDWFGTVRGRVGVLLTDQTLVYGTGGLAYGGVELSGQTYLSGGYVISGRAFPFFPASAAFNSSATNLGFAVGGGIESKFSFWLPARWTWKVEYLYVDLGSLNAATSYSTTFNSSLRATPITGPITTHASFTDNIVRVGLNYGF
jgi:outer membrane immunogenic protein